MKALAIDSSASCLCVAARNGADTVTCIYDIGMRQSETLLTAIDYAMSKAGIEKGELDFAALCAGPGSFTSLRLSFAALKALFLAWNTPVYAVPTLEAIAYPYLAITASCGQAGHSPLIIPVLDARKDRFYAAVCRAAPCNAAQECSLLSPQIILPAGDYTASEVLASLCGGTNKATLLAGNISASDISPDTSVQAFAVGSGAPLFKEKVSTDKLFPRCNAQLALFEYAATPHSWTIPCGGANIAVLPPVPVTTALFDIAEGYIKKGIAPMKDFDGPIYLRPCDAEAHLTEKNTPPVQ